MQCLILRSKSKTTSGIAMQSIRLLVSPARTVSTFSTKQRLQSSYPHFKNAKVDVYDYNKVIDSLLKNGSLSCALNLFDEMPTRDVVSWNIMISGLSRRGFPRKSLSFYNNMVSQGYIESSSTFSSVLSICSNAGFSKEGLQIHCRVFVHGLSSNVYIASTLIGLYMQTGLVDLALKLFNDLTERHLPVWNLVLRGFCERGRANDWLGSLKDIRKEGLEPNGLTFHYLIRGCANQRLLDEGKQLHCHVTKEGWFSSNLFVANALVDFYSACGIVDYTRNTFELISPEYLLSWNSMVSVYVASDLVMNALEVLRNMQLWGKRPSALSFLALLNLSSRKENIFLGEQVHCFVSKSGICARSIFLQSALIDMYGKCGDIESSVRIFQNLPGRTTECCNSLMTSLLQCNATEDVIELFGLMLDEDIKFDEVSLSSTLKALSTSAFADLASLTLLHSCAIKSGFENDIAVSCSLIDTYSRSGQINSFQKIFDNLSEPNTICFTSVINAYARNGMGMECLKVLDFMIQKGLKPDKVTFLCVLSGCNHSGLVQEAKVIFNSMHTTYNVCQESQHYSCMVDLLGRAGFVEEAEDVLKQAPLGGNSVMWSSLLQSCRVHRKEEVGRKAAENLMSLEPEDPAIWFLVSNFYSEIGDFETSMHIREIAVARKMIRDIGLSSIEVHVSGQNSNL